MLLKKLKTRKMMLFMVFSEVSYAMQAMLIKKKNGGCKKSLYYLIFHSPFFIEKLEGFSSIKMYSL